MANPPQNEPAGLPPQLPEDSYAAASQSTADFIKQVAPIQAKKQHKGRKRLILVIVLTLLLAGGGVAYMPLKPKKSEAPNPTPSPAAQEKTEEPTAETEHYTSQEFLLSIDYPKDWKLDDATQGKLTIESPLSKLKDSSGDQADGKVVVTFLRAGSNPENFITNNATAVIDSEKITYANPSQLQRHETYISFLGFGTSTGIDAIFVTGDGGYLKDQGVPKTDAVRSDPIISVSFIKCSGSTCQGALSIQGEEWGSNPVLASAKTILQSLVVK